MKLSDLSDEQCSRWIAEKLEPLTFDPNVHLKYWLRFADRHAAPHDMVHDPAMTVMLLTKLAWQDSAEPPDKRYLVEGFFTKHRFNIGRAVSEAFMLANGWSE